jgi:pentose-5-phosphate-3-epimerase
VRELRRRLDEARLPVGIEVDGGIGTSNIKSLAAGAGGPAGSHRVTR